MGQRAAAHVAHMTAFDMNLQSGRSIVSGDTNLLYGLDPNSNSLASLQAFLEIVHPEDRERLAKENGDAFNTGVVPETEFRVVRPDGEVRWIRALGRLIYDETGKPIRMIGTNMDITERKQAAEALQESEERFRHLYEGAPIAYFAVNMDGRIQMVNRSAENLLGCGRDTLIGRPVLDLYADTPAGRVKAELLNQRIHKGEEINGEELEMLSIDGSSVWISLTVQLTEDTQGQFVERLAMVVNITERKRAEQEIRRLALAVATANDGIVIADLDGRISFTNEAEERLLGYGPGEMIGIEVVSIHPESTRDTEAHTILEATYDLFVKTPRQPGARWG